MRRNQKEEDLRENHPYFDRPLFAVPRESKFRKICQTIVNARYDPKLKDSLSGKERKVRFKTLHKLLGLVTYLDWCMIIVTTLSAISMLFETPEYRYSTFLNGISKLALKSIKVFSVFRLFLSLCQAVSQPYV